MTYDEFLAHYGVKGMKWGVRRSKKQLATARAKRSDDKKRHDKNKKKGSDSLSDKELQQLVNRMNMEQNYNRLNSKRKTIDSGHETVKKVLAVGATANAAMTFASSPAGKALARALRNAPSAVKNAGVLVPPGTFVTK